MADSSRWTGQLKWIAKETPYSADLQKIWGQKTTKHSHVYGRTSLCVSSKWKARHLRKHSFGLIELNTQQIIKIDTVLLAILSNNNQAITFLDPDWSKPLSINIRSNRNVDAQLHWRHTNRVQYLAMIGTCSVCCENRTGSGFSG